MTLIFYTLLRSAVSTIQDTTVHFVVFLIPTLLDNSVSKIA